MFNTVTKYREFYGVKKIFERKVFEIYKYFKYIKT